MFGETHTFNSPNSHLFSSSFTISRRSKMPTKAKLSQVSCHVRRLWTLYPVLNESLRVYRRYYCGMRVLQRYELSHTDGQDYYVNRIFLSPYLSITVTDLFVSNIEAALVATYYIFVYVISQHMRTILI